MRDPVDIRKLSRALVHLAIAQAEADAQAQAATEPAGPAVSTEPEADESTGGATS
jgi:hypothetical protein